MAIRSELGASREGLGRYVCGLQPTFRFTRIEGAPSCCVETICTNHCLYSIIYLGC